MPAIEVRLNGPIFRPGLPGIVLFRAVQNAVRSLTELGEQRLDLMLRPRPAGVYLSVREAKKGKASTGHYRRSISTRYAHLSARIDGGNVVYGPWLEGVSPRNQTTRFKGYASFRRTAQWLEKQAKAVLQNHVAKAVRELNG